MLIQQLNRNDAERIQITVKNVDGGGSITTGLGVNLVGAGASIDGISSIRSTAATIQGFVGVAVQDIPINGFGLVTMWGQVNSVQISHVGSSITITRGDLLIPGAVAGTFFSSVTAQALSTVLYRYIIAATTPDAVSTQNVAFVQGIVRAS